VAAAVLSVSMQEQAAVQQMLAVMVLSVAVLLQCKQLLQVVVAVAVMMRL
jgi:hypothetical protein